VVKKKLLKEKSSRLRKGPAEYALTAEGLAKGRQGWRLTEDKLGGAQLLIHQFAFREGGLEKGYEGANPKGDRSREEPKGKQQHP